MILPFLNARLGLPVLTAALFALGAVSIATPASADNPCKSEDPDDFASGLTYADCDGDGIADDPYDYESGLGRYENPPPPPLDPDPYTVDLLPGGSQDYSHMPTTATDWYNSLSQADRRKLAIAITREAAPGRRLSDRELAAAMTVTIPQMDVYLREDHPTAAGRQKALAELAAKVGISTDPKYGYEDFGRPDYDYDDPWGDDVRSDVDLGDW